MSEIIIYEDPDAPNPVQVTLEGETVWLTQAQMAELFGRERSVITKHVRNVFRDGELNQEAVRAFFAHTAADGKTYQTECYNPRGIGDTALTALTLLVVESQPANKDLLIRLIVNLITEP